MNKIQTEILNGIETMINEKLKWFNCDKTLKGKVVSIDGSSCTVKINGEDVSCKIKNGINITVDDIVIIKTINGNFSDKYVDGKLGTVGSGGTGGSTVTDSATNGNIVVDDSEVTVYTHPSTHSADILTDGTNNKVFTTTEKSKLSGIADNANNYSHPSSHEASMITVADTGNHFTSNPKNVEAVLSELFINVDNGKTSLYSAIVGKGQTPTSTAFADLVTAINNIVTGGSGVLFASGTATSSASYLTVSNLTFRPKYVFMFQSASTSTYRGTFAILSDTANMAYYISGATTAYALVARDLNGVQDMYTESSNNITSNGFNAYVRTASRPYLWFAIGGSI